MSEAIRTLLPLLTGAAVFVVAVLAAGHALLYKRDARAAIGWVALIWLAPLLGPVLYLLFGINRIHRRARSLHLPTYELEAPAQFHRLARQVGADAEMLPLASLARLVDRLAGHPLVAGNAVQLLENGEAAYPAMLEAIHGAQHSVALSTYIFDNDAVGRAFLHALQAAHQRGVTVRVLVDAVGARYAFPPMVWRLRKAGVPAARFLPTFIPWRAAYVNLRNHRKLLVVDGRVGFTGGMNLRAGHVIQPTPLPAGHAPESGDALPGHGSAGIRDVHARITGPVVAQLQGTFLLDWAFTTGEELTGEAWLPTHDAVGDVIARGIPDGPEERAGRIRDTLLGALSVARHRVDIVTPYFLPDTALITALRVAALRGVEVNVLLPARNNLRLVQWASTALLWQVLESGCNVWLTPPPFDHAKLMVVDGAWALLGSANWDPRSLRLNFEFVVELYHRDTAARVQALTDERRAGAHRVTLAEVDGRTLPVRLRDGLARLGSPYL